MHLPAPGRNPIFATVAVDRRSGIGEATEVPRTEDVHAGVRSVQRGLDGVGIGVATGS